MLAMALAPTRAERQRLDLTDREFVRLVARRRLPKLPGTQGERWSCDCACGNTTVVRVKDLMSGNTRSCGCLTNRARKVADEPHRAPGGATLYAEVEAAVFAARAAGKGVRNDGVRGHFDGRTSRSSLYRLIRRASTTYALRAETGTLSL